MMKKTLIMDLKLRNRPLYRLNWKSTLRPYILKFLQRKPFLNHSLQLYHIVSSMPSIGQSPEAEFSLRPECKASSSKLNPYICIWRRSSALDHILSCQMQSSTSCIEPPRNQSVGGEESFCLINLMAVAEFLENVDMAGLGLGDSEEKVRCSQSF